MKFFSALIVLVCYGSFSLGQVTNTEKIIEAYGIEWYNQMSQENTELLNLLAKYVEFGFVVEEVNSDKASEIKVLQSIPIRSKSNETVAITQFLEDFNAPNFNPLIYGFFPQKEMQVYKLEGVNFIIYILPQATILNK